MKKDIYLGMPWSGIDEYYKLGKEYKLWGAELKKAVLTDIKKMKTRKKKLELTWSHRTAGKSVGITVVGLPKGAYATYKGKRI